MVACTGRGSQSTKAQACLLGKEEGRGACLSQRPPEGGEQHAQEPWSLRSGFHHCLWPLETRSHPRTGYMIFRTQCKMKLWIPMLRC